MNNNQIAIIPCPPLSQYKEQPKDQSLCTPEDCPHCHQKMWLSEKKKFMIEVAEHLNAEYHLSCYLCLMEKAKTNPEFFIGHKKVDI